MRKRCILLAGIMLLAAGCGERAVVEAYDEFTSNVVEIKPQTPTKITTQRDLQTIVQDGVVLNVSELSYEVWEKADIIERDGKLSSNAETLRGITLVCNADWLELGQLQPEATILDEGRAVFVMPDGTTLEHTPKYSNVNVTADMHKGNAKIVYEWFSEYAEGEERPLMVSLPFTFSTAESQIDINIDVVLDRYPW